MTTQSPTQRAHTSPSIEEALAALGDDFALCSLTLDEFLTIRSALKHAALEAECWSAIVAWCGALNTGRWVRTTQVCSNWLLNLYEGAYHGYEPVCVVAFTKHSRLEALEAAAAFCRAELAK